MRPARRNPSGLLPAAGKENRGGEEGNSSSSAVSTIPPKPLRPRPTQHPLAANVDPMALHPKHARTGVTAPATAAARPSAAATGSSSSAVPAVISTAPPPPLPRRRIDAAAASSAAASSAASHSTAATSTSSAAAASSSVGIARPPASILRPGGPHPAWSARTTALVRRVASHWLLLTRTHLVALGLDHRGDQMRMRHLLSIWLHRTRRTKARWQSWIPLATAARLHELGRAFARLRAKCTAPDRPSIRLATAVNLRGKADQFRRRMAMRNWKHVYARGVLLMDQAEQTASMRATFLARAALYSWIARRHRLHAAAHAGAKLQLLDAQRLRAAAWIQWRSAQETSALDRVASGVARKHAYRSSLVRAFKTWKRGVGLGIDRDRRAGLQLARRRLMILRKAWEGWHRGIHRLRVLGSVVGKRVVQLTEQAKHEALVRWHGSMLELRASARLMHIASRFRVRSQRLHALRAWGESVRLIRVRRLMGAASFDLLRRQWALWRSSLTLRRAQAKREKTADYHAAFQRLSRAVEGWRSFARAHRKQRTMEQTADAFLVHRSGRRLVRRWAARARATLAMRAHSALSSEFRHDSLARQGVKALRSLVTKRQASSSLRHLLLHAQRLHAFHLWKAFSDRRVASYNAAKKARRFAWITRMRKPFLAWRKMRRGQASLEGRLLAQARPLMLRAAHKTFLHWNTIAAASRAMHRKISLAQEVDRSTLLQSSLALWRDRFQLVRIERSQNELAVRHARRKLFAKVLFAWDSYAYWQQHVRRQMQEGVARVRRQLQFTARRRLFRTWRDKFLARRQHMLMAGQAELHHARWLVFKAYRSWQMQTHRLLALKAKLHLLTHRQFWNRWQAALSSRRLSLHKHVQALHFWARRVMRLAWSGWARFHNLARHKGALMEQAQEFRRANLRKHAARQWISAGLDLHETSLLIAHRAAIDSWNFPLTLSARRAALKCGRLWRYKTRQRRLQDQRRGGIITHQIVGALSYPRMGAVLASASAGAVGVPVFRAPPLPLSDPAEEEKKHVPVISMGIGAEHRMLSGSSSVSSLAAAGAPASSASNPITTFEAAAALFPRFDPAGRPPPRQPIELRLEELLRQPLLTQPLPAYSILQGFGMQHSASVAPASTLPAAVGAGVGAAAASFDAASIASPSGFSAPLRSHTGSSVIGFDDGGFSPLPPSAQFALSSAPPPLPVPDVSALESHLHRLMEWKHEAKARRTRLDRMETQIAQSAVVLPHLQSEYAALKSAVAADVVHRSYWLEQVQQVQRQIQQLIHSEQE